MKIMMKKKIRKETAAMEDYRSMLGFTPEEIEKKGPFGSGPEIRTWFDEDPHPDPETLQLELMTLEEEYEMKKSLLTRPSETVADAARVLIRWYFGLGMYDRAADICRELIGVEYATDEELIENTNPSVVFDYAESLLWSGEVEKGIGLLEKLIDGADGEKLDCISGHSETYASFLMNFRSVLALSFGKAGRYEKAAEQYYRSAENKIPRLTRPTGLRYDSMKNYAYVCCYYLGDEATADKAYRQVCDHYTGKSEEGGLIPPGEEQSRYTSHAPYSALREYAEFKCFQGSFDEAEELLAEARVYAAKDEDAEGLQAEIDKRIAEIEKVKSVVIPTNS